MKNYLISLKNIYRLLTLNDYPMYSNNVFSQNNRKGLTLVHFWTDVLCYPWRSTTHGKRIWRTEGSRNRLHSELCNRKEHFLYYEEYIGEILQVPVKDTILQQIDMFQSFLLKREYDHTILRRKLEVFLEKATQTDPAYSGQAGRFFQKGLDAYSDPSCEPAETDAWLLTMLTLHAIAGPEMNDTAMQSLRDREDILPDRIFLPEKTDRIETSQEKNLLTNRNSELWQPALQADRFFGREKELFDLNEMALKGGHYLISGMGGTGKTELLRQHLNRILRDHTKRDLATVQFEGNLPDSFNRVFRNLTGDSSAERYQECLYALSTGRDAILYIDNLDTAKLTPEDIEKLKELPCTIFASSRQKHLEGFLEYPVTPLDGKSAALVFRSNYGFALTEGEKIQLDEILSQNGIHHPLILCLFGSAARERRWSIREFGEQIAQNGSNLRWKTGMTEIRLQTILSNLYTGSDLTQTELQIVRLLAILPYQRYTKGQLGGYLDIRDSNLLSAALNRLCETGWLEEFHRQDSYSIHPVIAESVLTNSASESEFQLFWKKASEELGRFLEEKEKGNDFFFRKSGQEILPGTGEEEFADPDSLVELAYLVFSASEHIRGNLSGDFVFLCETACYILLQYHYEGRKAVSYLEKIVNRCRTCPEESGLLLDLIKMGMLLLNHDEVESVQSVLKQKPEIPQWMYYELYLETVSSYVSFGNYQEAEQMALEILSTEIPLSFRRKMKLHLELLLGQIYQLLSRKEECEFRMKNVIAAAGEDMDSYGNLALMAYAKLAWHYIERQDPDRAAECYRKAEELLPKYGHLEYKLQLLNTRGYLAELQEDWETALQSYKEMLDICEKISGKGSTSYCNTCSLLGRVYSRMGRFLESYEQFETALALIRKYHPAGANLMVTLNNTGAAYLDGGEPEKAYPVLFEARELAAQVGEVAVAETGYNLSRVWRARGNREKERAYLKDCLPIFETYYGPEHTKTIRCKQRLKEVTENENLTGL